MRNDLQMSKVHADKGRTGTINASFDCLVETLGEPDRTVSADQKVEAYWSVVDKYGCRLFVWNYKDGPVYTNGKNRMIDIDSWSMDGCKRLAIFLFGENYVE